LNEQDDGSGRRWGHVCSCDDGNPSRQGRRQGCYRSAAEQSAAALSSIYGHASTDRERLLSAGTCVDAHTVSSRSHSRNGVARFVPVSPVLHGHEFWRRERGRLVATPLFVALVIVETTDVVFALDSIPAVLAVTRIRSSCTRRM